MFHVSDDSIPGITNIQENTLSIEVTSTKSGAFVEFLYAFPANGKEYVFFPACCYKGNQFCSLKKNYPPSFSPEEASVDMPVTITDVIRLEKDGSGKIEVTTGDVSVPCVGIYSPEHSKGILFFTIQQINRVNLGLSYEKGVIGVSYPHMRKEKIYRWPFMHERSDSGMNLEKGQKIEIPYRLLEFPCESMQEFYRVFFENRKCMGMDDSLPKILPFNEQFQIQKDKFNAMNWREEGGFYGVGTESSAEQVWQPGWVGGGMSSYALMKLGGPLEWARGISTLHHLFRTQGESGFFYGTADATGAVVRDPSGIDRGLIRESGDVLYFLFKHFRLMHDRGQVVSHKFEDGARKLSDAFVGLWQSYGQLGQFVNVNTGELIEGGSTSGGIVPAGLVSAYQYFKDEKYLDVAKAVAEQYFHRDAVHGYTTGGPGEILQGPDSESAFGLLESFVELYDETRDRIWLERSIFMLHQCSSWVVPYNYCFPAASEFGRLHMKTVGSVFANVQNKHAAPGICTLSGNSIYKIYQWTGEKAYLQLLREIALTISQYMSSDQRPIYSWDVPKDASLLEDKTIRVQPEKLPQGFICERVNLSDWEGERCVGGVFNGSCWCETSNLLTLAETIALLEQEMECKELR